MKIDPHDVEIRVNQARRFLIEGHKVQIVQNFRGREMMHRDRGDQRMKAIIEKLSDLGKVELAPRMMGRRMTVILAPDKPKVDAYLRKHGPVKPHKEPAAERDGQPHTPAAQDVAPRETAPPSPTVSATPARSAVTPSVRTIAKPVPVRGGT
jgi:hypothetical protein